MSHTFFIEWSFSNTYTYPVLINLFVLQKKKQSGNEMSKSKLYLKLKLKEKDIQEIVYKVI